MALTAPVRPARATAVLKVRQNISAMSPADVKRFRDAMQAFMAINDNRGYQFYAGWHGIPMAICVHHSPLFLPWHRGYLYHFELALQSAAGDPEVTLPWWDWLNEPGIPAAYQDGVLAKGDVKPFGVVQPDPDWPTETHRTPGVTPPGQPAPLPPPLNTTALAPLGGVKAEDWVMAAPSFTEATRRIEALHDNMHNWVGGEMRDPTWAAYDPIFWAHHTMVDRLWRMWQHRNPGGDPPAYLADSCMTFAQPPTFAASDLRDVKALGYEYAGVSSSVEGPG
jgi:tyrosinase